MSWILIIDTLALYAPLAVIIVICLWMLYELL
jgi:hypothetical protein